MRDGRSSEGQGSVLTEVRKEMRPSVPVERIFVRRGRGVKLENVMVVGLPRSPRAELQSFLCL